MRDVVRRRGKALVHFRAIDDQRIVEAELHEGRLERLGLGFGQLRLLENDELGRLHLGRERMAQAEGPDLLRQIALMAARARAEGLTAADEDARPARTMTGATAAL